MLQLRLGLVLFFSVSLAVPTPVVALDLIAALQQAESQDPRFAELKARRQAAEQGPAVARAALLPQVVATADINRTELEQDSLSLGAGLPPGAGANLGGSSAFNSRQWGVRVTQPLFDWNAFKQVSRARAQQTAESARLNALQQTLRLDVAEDYFAVLRAQARLQLAQTRERGLNAQLQRQQARFREGEVPELDVLESQAQRDEAYSQRLVAEESVNSSQQQLMTRLGLPLSTRLTPLKSVLIATAPEPNDPEAWVRLAQENSPNLLSARAALKASDENLSALRGGYLPQINAVGARSSIRQSGSDALAATLNTGERQTLGIEARWALFDGGRTRATRRQALQEHEAQSQVLISSEQDVAQQARVLFHTIRTDLSRLSAQIQQLRSAERAYATIEAGYQEGTHSIVDVMNAETRVANARATLSDLRFDYLSNSLRLHATSGLLDASIFERFNSQLDLPTTPTP